MAKYQQRKHRESISIGSASAENNENISGNGWRNRHGRRAAMSAVAVNDVNISS